MRWGHVLAAAGRTPAGLHAVSVAADLARRAGLDLSVVTVLDPSQPEPPPGLAPWAPIVVRGVPGIEITRLAEDTGADLLVLGRQVYPGESGPCLGPTADAVVRRCRIPCLFVPEGQRSFAHLVVAVDGTARGLAVLGAAEDLAALTGAGGELVLVEPGEATPDGERSLRGTRTLRVEEELERRTQAGQPVPFPLTVGHGEPAGVLRAALDDRGSEALVVGARLGGPGGPPPSSGVGRTLLYTVHCAVLTVPL